MAFRAWSLESAAPGREMSKPPPKPVKPGKEGARWVPWPLPCPALPLPLGRADQARTRPRASLSMPPTRVGVVSVAVFAAEDGSFWIARRFSRNFLNLIFKEESPSALQHCHSLQLSSRRDGYVPLRFPGRQGH